MFYCDYAYSRYRDPFPFLYASRVSYEPIPYCKEYPFHIPEGGVEPLPSCARSDMYKTELCILYAREDASMVPSVSLLTDTVN